MYCFFSRNSIFKLSGGRLRPDIEGLKRKLAFRFNENVLVPGLEVRTMDSCPQYCSDCFWLENGLSIILQNCSKMKVGECIGTWWRPNFKTLMYPFLPPNVKHPKQFAVPKNFKLLAVPLCQIHENEKTYGPIISHIRKLLSKFSFNMMEI
ncbi:LOW QUALITY PROTEIN: hypothetical protein BRARA_F02644 [Brassica rapa]|uniref:Uncharacterized protein n=1 Tax=Brassica campestris TaxID=3711 RepID=A0A397Z139_BRACM|nr:LOW QUALITY PROTEIN: hypothetical protein BRARA_F02644 [Brassica rapa]